MNNTHWNDLAAAACAHAGICLEKIETIATWDQKYCANAVYRINGQQYLKVFGPTSGRQFYTERCALKTLLDYPTIPAPRIVGEGEPVQQPPYLIVTGIPGETAEHIWDDLPRTEQLAIAREIGLITAAIHRLPQDDLAAVEAQFGGRHEQIKQMLPRRHRDLAAAEMLSTRQREEFIRFVEVDAPQLIDSPLTFTHFELAHNHIYLNRDSDHMRVSGFIDWADALLGPEEWDIVYLWFWTFSGDREAMRECLQMIYTDRRPPDRFARRCLASIMFTISMGLLWPDFMEQGVKSDNIIREMTAFYFPEELFGPPD